MGSKQSLQYLTPEFVASEWEAHRVMDESSQEQYGMTRTFRHCQTGELIDEYDLVWGNEEDYSFYLHSFNWRINQPNIVNSKFIQESNHDDFCSRVYTVRVYIEHIKTRLSEISDIPYPDNLYIIMEALEGYQKLYEHSKYFQVQQNQICVDCQGNVKVWVNANLSRNYPERDWNSETNIEANGKGTEQDIVCDVIRMIADNTDPQLEPSPTFKEYFSQQNANRTKGFEEAKLLVNNYAKYLQMIMPGYIRL